MLQRFDAALDGRSILAISDKINLVDIIENPPKYDTEQLRRAMHPGTRLAARIRRALTVTLKIVLSVYNVDARAEAMTQIADWLGAGGWLSINSRPGKRLRVTPDGVALKSSLQWLDEIEIPLTAYDQPYWEDADLTEVTITDSGVITAPGTVDAVPLMVDVTNTGDADLTELTLISGDTVMRFTGIKVAPGEHFLITYSNEDLLIITAGSESALGARSPSSSDDLVATCRQETEISVSADQSVSATFSARGRYR
jgi:hypothetical protein